MRGPCLSVAWLVLLRAPAKRPWDGQTTHHRRAEALRHHSDLRRKERRAHANSVCAADRRAADLAQPASAGGYRQLPAPDDAIRRGGEHRRHQARGFRTGGHLRGNPPHLDHRALRSGAQDACVDPRARPDAGTRRCCHGLAARRLRDRQPPDRPAPFRARSIGRRDRAGAGLCPRACARWRPAGRRVRFPRGVGRRDRECADGGGAGQRHLDAAQRRTRARDRRPVQPAGRDGCRDREYRPVRPRDPRCQAPERRDVQGDGRPHRSGLLRLRRGDHWRRSAAGGCEGRRHVRHAARAAQYRRAC